MSSSRLTAALKALNDGFTIFPTEPNDKTPIRIYQDRPKDDAPWTIRWSEVATNDVDTVVRWWTHAPEANIGIACKPSGVLVVDCDQPKREGMLDGTPWAHLHEYLGPLVDGETLYDAVAQRYGQTPQAVADAFDTYAVRTGSGGLHLYYRWPDGVQSTQDSIVKGVLDVRGNGGERGGYVLGAGSATAKGSYAVHNQRPVRPAPSWLVELCREKPRLATNRRSMASGPFQRPVNPNLNGLVRQVRTAPEGNRNNALVWSARAMCTDGATQEECEALLIPAYLDNDGPGGERQARQSIASAYRLQRRKLGI